MTNLPDISIKPESDKKINDKPWWNRSLLGEGGLLEAIWRKFSKPEVSESAIFLHNREIMDARVFAKTAEAIDSEKFSNSEFLMFVKMRYYMVKEMAEYQGLYQPTKLLQVAIEAKNSYITLDQTELRYRSMKQQEFYNFVETLLCENENNFEFRKIIQTKVVELLPEVKTEEGKVALQAYAKELDNLAGHELGLKLLSLFKTYQLADYSILRIISDVVASLGEKDLTDFKSLISIVHTYYSAFEKLRVIIGISQKQSTPETYARIIQYLGLANRHQQSFSKFSELIGIMRKWYRPYYAIVGIRKEYTPENYKQPKDFSQEIPGLPIYEKYKKSLTDKKTGYSYVDFGDEAT